MVLYHIMKGKTYKRAIRGHSLVSTALKQIIMEKIPKLSLPSNDEICKLTSQLHACSEEVFCDLNPQLLGHAACPLSLST